MSLQRYAIVFGNNVVNVVEYDSQPTTPPPGFDVGYVAVQSNTAGPGWTYENGQFVAPPVPPIPPEQLLMICKQNAMGILTSTDWVELPSVSNTSVQPHLTNAAEFMSYRNQIRQLAVNPVEHPVWPTRPDEQWSS